MMFTATVFGRLLVETQIRAIIANEMLTVTDHIYTIWALVISFLLFVGMFMETLANILILVPVMLPVAYSVGIDPTHFCVVMVCCLDIGFQTPPYCGLSWTRGERQARALLRFGLRAAKVGLGHS
jgi:C4-dicarboxylate transporter DctM subunit